MNEKPITELAQKVDTLIALCRQQNEELLQLRSVIVQYKKERQQVGQYHKQATKKTIQAMKLLQTLGLSNDSK